MWEQRFSDEPIGHLVGAVPIRSWLSCERNLNRNKTLLLEQDDAKKEKKITPMDIEMCRLEKKKAWKASMDV